MRYEKVMFIVFLLHSFVNSQLLAPSDYVDTRISSGGFGWGVGGQNPGPQVPFGSFRLGPDGSHDEGWDEFDHYGGYHFNDTTIRAFSHTHTVGAGVSDYGNIGIMAVSHINDTMVRNYNYRSHFNHSTEVASPGLYSVYLEDPQVQVELTAAGTHSGLHRYTFDQSSTQQSAIILVDVCHTLMKPGSKACNLASVNVDLQAATISGSLLFSGALTGRSPIGGVWIYFVAQFEGVKPLSYGVWSNYTLMKPTPSCNGSDSLGAFFDFGPRTSQKQITVRVGISWVNSSLALWNMQQQAGTADFNNVLKNTQQLWAQQLSLINVQSSTATKDDFVMFYSGLYHTFTAPSTASESYGYYLGFDGIVHQYPAENGTYYTDMSIWDTHRSEFPFLALVQPIVSRDIVRSLLTMSQQGGDIPRWPIANTYTGCMVGNHAWITIADNWVKGIRDFDIEYAYEIMKLEATTPRPHNSRVDLANYTALGYIPKESDDDCASVTLEYAFDDWAVSTVALALNYTDDYNQFFKQSKNYRNIWESNLHFMCPRLYNGTIECPEDLHLSYPWTTGYTEGDAWQWWCFVPQDPEGLVALFPSPEEFALQLDTLFNKSLPWPTTMWPNPYYWAGNEPDILAAWLFNFGNRSDLTQKWTRIMTQTQYNAKADGIPGNDDYGTMSAWLVWALMGFYPLAGSTRYSIGSPLFESAYISRKSFGLSDIQILANNASANNYYIQKATVNGVPLTKGWIDHSDLNNGELSVLEFWMGDTPAPF